MTLTEPQLKWLEANASGRIFLMTSRENINNELVVNYVRSKYKFNTLSSIANFLTHLNYNSYTKTLLTPEIETNIIAVLNDKVNHGKKSMRSVVNNLICVFNDTLDWSKLNDDAIESLFPNGKVIGKYKLGIKEIKHSPMAEYIDRTYFDLEVKYSHFLTLALTINDDEMDGLVKRFVDSSAYYIASTQALSPRAVGYYSDHRVNFEHYLATLKASNIDSTKVLKMLEKYANSLQLAFVAKGTDAMYKRYNAFFINSGLEKIINENQLNYTLHKKLKRINMESKLKR